MVDCTRTSLGVYATNLGKSLKVSVFYLSHLLIEGGCVDRANAVAILWREQPFGAVNRFVNEEVMFLLIQCL